MPNSTFLLRALQDSGPGRLERGGLPDSREARTGKRRRLERLGWGRL